MENPDVTPRIIFLMAKKPPPNLERGINRWTTFSFTRNMGTNSCQNYTHHVSIHDMIQFTSYFSLIVAQFSLRNCQVNCRPLGLLLATYDKTLEVSCDLILSGVIEYCKYLGKKGQFIDKVKSTVLLWEQRYNVMTVKSV